MVEEVIWSPLAVKTYNDIIEYLLEKFGEAAVIKFVRLVDNKIMLIKSRPQMFRPTGHRPHTYITSLRKKATLTYRYLPKNQQIEIVVFWGMQDPKNKPV